jgi:hypothetical protein
MLAMLKAKCQRGLPGIFNKTTVDRVSTRFVSANHPFKPDELKNIVITCVSHQLIIKI